MPRLPDFVRGLALTVDLRTGRWTIRAAAGQFEVREWTWGERRRLVALAVVEGGLRRDLFLAGLLELLVEPAPEPEWQIPIAAATLHLLGVPEGSSTARPLTELEGLAARTFGWLPDALDRQSAGAIDRLLAPILSSAVPLSSPTGGVAEAGEWTRIEFPEPPGTSGATTGADPTPAVDGLVRAAEARLDRMLAVVARWAGVVSDVDSDPLVHPAARRETAGATSPPPKRPEIETPATGAARVRKVVPETASEPRHAPDRPDRGAEGYQGLVRLPASSSATAASRGASQAVPETVLWSGRVGRLSPERRVRSTAGSEPRPAVTRVAGDEPRPGAATAAHGALGAAGVGRGVTPVRAAPRSRVGPPSGRPDWPTVPARPPKPFGEWSAAGEQGSVRARFGGTPGSAPSVTPPAHWEVERVGSSAALPWPPPVSSEVAAPGVTPSDPFLESGLEEQLADVLERAARESGVELP